jgi:hypothetical protein
MADDELASWLRRKVGADLKHWRDLEAAYLPGVPKEGEWLWAGAREHADHAEARLAVLDEHYILWRHDTSEAYEEFSVVSIGGANKDHGCVTCHYYGQGGVKGYGYCRTVRHIGYAYRRQAGYREAWKP